MKRTVLACLLVGALAASGDGPEPKSGTKVLGEMRGSQLGTSTVVIQRLEVYEDWERGYFVYKQTARFKTEGEYENETVSITAVPIRADWPPKQQAERGGG